MNRKCISTFFLFLLLSFNLTDIVTSQQNEVRSLIEKGNQFRLKGQYAEAQQSFEQAKNVAESLNDQLGVAESLNNIGNICYLTSKYQSALQNFEQSLKLSETIGNQKGIAESLNNIGRVHYMQDDHNVALHYYEKSLTIRKQIQDKAGIAESMNSIGLVHYIRGENLTALDYLEKSLALRNDLGDEEAIATSLNNIGLVHSYMNNYESAIKYYEKSLTLREKLEDKDGVAFVLNSLGWTNYHQGNFEAALGYHKKSLKLFEELDDKQMIGFNLNSIGQIYQSRGQNILAMNAYQKSLELRKQINDKSGVAHVLIMIGVLHYTQGNYQLALDYHKQGLQMSDSLQDKKESVIALRAMGADYIMEGNYIEALKCYQKGLENLESNEDKYQTASLLNDIAIVYSQMGNLELAMKNVERSLGISKEIEHKEATMLALNLISEIKFKQGLPQESLDYAARSVSLARSLSLHPSIWGALTNLGKAYFATNQREKAIQSVEEAIHTIETLRMDVLGGEQERQGFFQDKVTPYHLIVDFLVQAGERETALAYAERAKSRALLDVLQSGRTTIAGALTSEEVNQEQSLSEKLISFNRQVQKAKLDGNVNESRLRELTASLEKARLNLEQFRTNIYAAHPELKIHRGEAGVVTPEGLNRLLSDPKDAFLEYVVTPEKTFVFVVAKGENKTSIATHVFTINVKQSELASRVSNFRNQMADRKPNFRIEAAALHNLLISPANEILQTKRNLVIVPDGILWELPFQALLSNKDRYLLQDYSLYYVPSLTVLDEMKKLEKQKSTSSKIKLFAMGNPALGTKTRENIKEIFRNANLDPLPQAEKEVQALAQLYGDEHSKIYIGSDAREDKVKNEANQYNFLHFATHGLLNNSTPLYSQILLAQNDTQQEDGLLEAWEILNLRLNADLVVLSACDTALGKVGKGEGMIGLTWALFVAGVPNTVVSQWTVDSTSTTELMIQFHKELKLLLSESTSKSPIPDALRAAALHMLQTEEYRHPFYWAPFVVIGSGQLTAR